MIKLLNKFLFHIKNIILPINLLITIYIVVCMFSRLGKNLTGSNFLEFLEIVFPFMFLLFLWLINLFLKHEKIQNNTFYNITSTLVMITISIFCYRTLMDENMLFWHKYGYKVNFNYFSDQIPPIKVMLYGLSISNILLICENFIKNDNSKIENKKNKNVYNKNNKKS